MLTTAVARLRGVWLKINEKRLWCCLFKNAPPFLCNISPGQNSGIEKAFLFDVVSKIYIATDSSPVDMQSYELCCDMIDVVIDVSCIYG